MLSVSPRQLYIHFQHNPEDYVKGNPIAWFRLCRNPRQITYQLDSDDVYIVVG